MFALSANGYDTVVDVNSIGLFPTVRFMKNHEEIFWFTCDLDELDRLIEQLSSAREELSRLIEENEQAAEADPATTTDPNLQRSTQWTI